MSLAIYHEKLVDANNHSAAAKLVIDILGTDDEKTEINQIVANHYNRGYITHTDQTRRDDLNRKYWDQFKKMCEEGF
jgi:hypothetical protein